MDFLCVRPSFGRYLSKSLGLEGSTSFSVQGRTGPNEKQSFLVEVRHGFSGRRACWSLIGTILRDLFDVVRRCSSYALKVLSDTKGAGAHKVGNFLGILCAKVSIFRSWPARVNARVGKRLCKKTNDSGNWQPRLLQFASLSSTYCMPTTLL
jgi:hypothetical protein